MGKAKQTAYLYAELVPDHERLVENILTVYDSATKQDVVDGASWYGRALELANAVAELTGYSTPQIVAIMALTSSATSWNVNNSAPMRIIAYLEPWGDPADAPRPSWFNGGGAMWKKVLRVLDGDLSAVTGPKTQAFNANILGDSYAVTVDRHAMRIAMGYGMFEATSIGPFRKIAEAYRDAADLRGIEPSAMQAICWVAYRRHRDIERLYG